MRTAAGAAHVRTAMARRATASLPDSASRTLVLGLDAEGRIVQSGRNAASVLALEPAELLGTPLADLVEEGPEQVEGVLRAVGEGQERTSVWRMRGPGEAVVTVQPMIGGSGGPAALAHIRVALPSAERFQDPVQVRRALFDDPLTRFGANLDLDQCARELADVVVPHYCNVAAIVVLESIVAADESPGAAGGSGACGSGSRDLGARDFG